MNVAQAITDTILDLNTDKALLKSDVAVIAALCRHINNQTLDCYPSINRLMELVDMSRRTVTRSIARLKRLGYITVTYRYGQRDNSGYGGGQRSNLYVVHGMSQRLKKEDNQLNDNNNIVITDGDMGGRSSSDTPYITNNINNNNIISNAIEKKEEETEQEIIIEDDDQITLADDAKVDRIPLGNPLCPMTPDYHIPINWITWAMVTYDVDVDKAKQVTLDYVRHYVERKDYSTGGQFQSMGWERLYRTYWADYIESKLKAVKAEQDKTCDCGKHHAGREHATPHARARAVKYNLIMGLGYVNELAIAYLADYERHHGLVWDDALESTYRIKTTRMPSYETLSRIAKLSLPAHLVPTDIKMAS